MTMMGSEAFEAILAHHRSLSDGIARRSAALGEAVRAGDGWAPAAAELIAFLAEEILPHAAAEEKIIYLEARAHPDLEQPVSNMIEEHRVLAEAAERLASTESAGEADSLATTIGSLFTTHVQKENDVILPLLGADEKADLSVLVEQMHRLTGEALQSGSAGQAASDTVVRLTSLLLDAASGLAEIGEGDRACRLAAATWAILRKTQPQLAVRVTAKLHHLARSVPAEPVKFISGPRSSGDSDDGDAELDVRALAPAQRHEKIFATYSALGPGTGFMLINDHDPKPLRYQFAAEHAGDYTWEPLEEGPSVWRVRIGRPATVVGAR